MKLSSLTDESTNLKAKKATSVCQYLTACGINFKKKFRIEPIGADFYFDDADTAKKVLVDLKNHERIGKSEHMTMQLSDKLDNVIKVFYIEDEE